MSEQLLRLAAFRRHHPRVVIGRADFGGWEARVPLPRGGEGFFAPRPLGDLLDALEEELHAAPP